MPKLPTDMAKAHAAAEKSRKRLARRKKKAAEDEAKTAAALEEMAQRMAAELGAKPGQPITVFMCRRGRR